MNVRSGTARGSTKQRIRFLHNRGARGTAARGILAVEFVAGACLLGGRGRICFGISGRSREAGSRLPHSAGDRILPVPMFKLREGEEERKYPAPSPGCRVLSPFTRHSPAILCIVPLRNCSLLYISTNFLDHSAQRATPLHTIARSSGRTAPVSSPRAPLRPSCAAKTKQIGNVFSIEQNSFLAPFTISYEWRPHHSPWEKTYEVQVSFTARRSCSDGRNSGLRR